MRRLFLVISAILFSALVCRAAGSISITVTDKATGEPITNAAVAAANDKSSTNDFGQCTIGLPENAGYFYIQVTQPGYVAMAVEWQNLKAAKSLPQQFSFAMTPGTAVGGKVVDQAGKPVGGATVHVEGNDDQQPDGAIFNECYMRHHHDAAGSWISHEAPSDLKAATYKATARGFIGESYFQQVPSIEELRKRTFTIVLQRAASLSGTVLDPAGQPVAHATLTSGENSTGVRAKARSDTDGNFTLGHLAPGNLTFGVTSDHFAPQIVEATVPTTQPVTVHMLPGTPMKFHVVDHAGNPISGVNIFIAQYHHNFYVRYTMKTKPDGNAIWPGGPPDPIVMNFWKKGLGMVTDKDVSPSTQPIQITLGPKTHVTASVIDGDTGKPIDNFTVLTGVIPHDMGRVYFSNESWAGTITKMGDGKFTYAPDQPYPQYVLRVQAPGYLSTDSNPFDNVSDELPLQFKLVKGKGFTGTVYGEGHKPLAGADVYMVLGDQPLQIENHGKIAEWNMQTAPVQTDTQGHFAFMAQADPFDLVCVTPEGYAQLDVPPLHPAELPPNLPSHLRPPTTRPSKYDLIIQPWGNVRGKLMVGSKAAGHAQMGLQMLHAGGWAGQPQPQVFLSYTAPTDANGQFQFDHVPPGNVMVGKVLRVGLSEGYSVGVTLTVKPGQTININLGGTGRPVVGKFAIPAGFPTGWIPWDTYLTPIEPTLKGPDMPLAIRLGSEEAKIKWLSQWEQTPDGKAWLAAQKRAAENSYIAVQFDVAKDGAFRIDDVPAGKYSLAASFFPANVMRTGGWNHPLGTGQKQIEVPPMPGNRSDTPLDVGVISVTPPPPNPTQ